MTASIETLLAQMLDIYSYDPDGSKIASGNNVPAVVTLPANDANKGQWYIDTVAVSYSAAPTNGLLTVYAGATPIFQVDIIAGGVTTVAVFKKGIDGGAMSVALSAGGSGITGRLNVNAKLV